MAWKTCNTFFFAFFRRVVLILLYCFFLFCFFKEMGMIVYCSATSDPTESMFTCTLLFHFISDCFGGHLIKKKKKKKNDSPHVNPAVRAHILPCLQMLMWSVLFPCYYSGKKNLFICVYRDVNEQDAWFVCVRVCVHVYESIIRVCACAVLLWTCRVNYYLWSSKWNVYSFAL